MRYVLRVRADHKDQVEAIISKLPSHYITAWVAKTKEGTVQYDKPTKGAVETQLPVGQLATLTPEGVETPWYLWNRDWYLLSGEFNDWQLASLKKAMVDTKLIEGSTTWQSTESALP